MTTWHENDSLIDFMRFAKHCAGHSSVELQRTLILDIGQRTRETGLLAMYGEA